MNHSRQAVEKRSMLPIKDLEKLIGEADSGIYKIREEVHVALHPRFSSDLRVGLLNYFNSQINKWHKELNGILAGYGKLQVKSPMGQMINEEPYFHLDVVSDFWVFRPDGAELRGLVTKKSQSHISCLVHGIFNVPCYKPPEQKSGWATNVQLDSQVKLKVIKTDMSQPVPYILGSFLGLVGADDKAPDAIDSPVQIVEPSQWPQAVASGVLPSTPSKESPKPKQKRAPAKKAAAQPAQPAQNGLPPTLPQLPTQPLPAVPQVTATLPAATATPPKGRKKAAAKNSEPPAVTPTATVVAAVPQLPTQPLPAAAAIQQTLAAPATPKGRKKATPKKPAAPTAPVVPASSLDSLIQAPDVVSLIQSLQQPVAPAAPQQPVPPAEITPKSRKKPTKKASQPSSTPNNLAPAAATTPLVTAVAQPPAPASANINQMLSSLAPMQPTAPSPATVPAAESAPSASPSKKAKERKKDEVDAAVGTPSRSQSLKEETVSPPPQTPVSSVPPHLLNGGGVGGPMNSTEMATPDSASQGVNGKKSKKKKRHISDMEDHPPATPIAMPSLDDGAYGDGETPAKKKKKKKDKKRDGDEGQLPSTIQNETAVSNIMDDSSAATTSSKKSKKKKKKSEQ